MKVIIPVAGAGTRLKPHTLTQPKPLLRIGGKTILDYLVTPLLDLEPEEVIFVVGYKGDVIKDYVQKNYSFKSSFVYQDKLLGLGYALHMALEKESNSSLLVILGDTIIEGDLRRFVGAGSYTLGLHAVDDPSRFGIAEIKGGVISSLVEKPSEPKSNLAIVGLYYFEESDKLKRELSGLVDSGKTTSGEIQLTDALAAMLSSGIEFTPFEVDHWYDCGKKETMLATNSHLLKRMPPPQPIEGSAIVGSVFISNKAHVENSVIGPDVSVAAGATVRNSVVSDSIIGRDARLENVVVQQSIIGANASIKGRKKILNIGDSTQISD